MAAAEIFNLLGENHPFSTNVQRGEGNFDPYGDAPAGPVRGPDGRFAPGSGKYVPHQAMERERVRRKAAEAKAQELEVRHARAEEKLSTLNQLMQAAGLDPASQPQRQQHDQRQQQPSGSDGFVDPEIDVFAAVAQLQQQNSRLQAEREEQRFLETARADMVQFTKQTPDFFDGVQHLVQSRDRELQTMGMADKQQRIRQIAIEEKVLMQQAFAENRSAAAVLYELASQRGFTGGRQPRPRPNVQYDPKIVDQIQQTQRGQAASGTLSNAGGSGGAGLTVQQIADMPEEQFDALIRKMGGIGSDSVRRAFGG